jgi:hypothetical protein
MIGYYIHHQGRGHLHRAIAIAEALQHPVVGLSSLPRPEGWNGDWVQLARDDEGTSADDPDAFGRLHWAPLHDAGLRERMAQLSQWIAHRSPALLVVDVSVEVALLARLHGVPVVTVAMPGDRSDAAHALGYDVSTAVIAAWPREARGMISGLSRAVRRRIEPVGAISRFSSRRGAEPVAGKTEDGSVTTPRSVVLLAGTGGSSIDVDRVKAAEAETPGWTWTVLGAGNWVDDPWPLICAADVVVTHAGQNALADVAAARRPAIVIPEDRPHSEQATTAAVLAASELWPALVLARFARTGWTELLQEAATLDGGRWSAWNDGLGAKLAAGVIRREITNAQGATS